MTPVEDFARITKKIIAKDGFDGYLPTVIYPGRHHLAVWRDAPEGSDLESIALEWAGQGSIDDEEFLVAFKIDPVRFKVIRRYPGGMEERVFDAVGGVSGFFRDLLGRLMRMGGFLRGAKPGIFKTKTWALKVAGSWTVDDSEDAIVIIPEDGDDGALVISAFIMESPVTMIEALESLQGAVPSDASLSEVRLGDFTGYGTTYSSYTENGETAWRAWCVFCRDVHLYLTYDCALQRRGKDDAAVDGMLKTIRCIWGA